MSPIIPIIPKVDLTLLLFMRYLWIAFNIVSPNHVKAL